MQMGFRTKIQLIQRKSSQQWYVNFPAACAQMMDFEKGEEFEWVLTDAGDLLLQRLQKKSVDRKKRGKN
jgi:ribosomal silencing factor RsfS